jgi:hypothetical protein
MSSADTSETRAETDRVLAAAGIHVDDAGQARARRALAALDDTWTPERWEKARAQLRQHFTAA